MNESKPLTNGNITDCTKLHFDRAHGRGVNAIGQHVDIVDRPLPYEPFIIKMKVNEIGEVLKAEIE